MRISAEAIRQNPVLHLEQRMASAGTRERLDELRGYAQALRDLGVLKHSQWEDVNRRISSLHHVKELSLVRRRSPVRKTGVIGL